MHCPNPRAVWTTTVAAPQAHEDRYVECSGHGACDSSTTSLNNVSPMSPNHGYYSLASAAKSWGKCTCQWPYHGTDCSRKHCPAKHGKVCSGNGYCDHTGHAPSALIAGSEDKSSGLCKCTAPWFGPDCSLRHCPGDWTQPTERGATQNNYGAAINQGLGRQGWHFCSGHGTCHLAGTTQHPAGTCECNAGWDLTPACDQKRCPVHNGRVCNGEGLCNSHGLDAVSITARLPSGRELLAAEGGRFPGTCACTLPYYNGPLGACEMRLCPGSVALPRNLYGGKNVVNVLQEDRAKRMVPCSGHGSCVNQAAEFTYARHASLSAPTGVAEGGVCLCQAGYTGEDCSKKACPGTTSDGRDCNDQGTCDSATGQCQCKSSHFGEGCQHRHCPGQTPRHHPKDAPKRRLWSSDFYECHAGTRLPRGTCDLVTGSCTCNVLKGVVQSTTYYGASCDKMACPIHDGKECNGEGSCHAEQKGTGLVGCKCNEAWEGSACEHIKCPKWRMNGAVCGGSMRGVCLQSSGDCNCNPGYSGQDCGTGRGPAADL